MKAISTAAVVAALFLAEGLPEKRSDPHKSGSKPCLSRHHRRRLRRRPPDFEASRRSARTARAGTRAWSFLKLGNLQILSGYDHLLFLAGLFLAAATRRCLAPNRFSPPTHTIDAAISGSTIDAGRRTPGRPDDSPAPPVSRGLLRPIPTSESTVETRKGMSCRILPVRPNPFWEPVRRGSGTQTLNDRPYSIVRFPRPGR